MQPGDHVSTEAQRQALENMSNELIRKLNLMIQQQEQRVQEFARTHHSQLSTPAVPSLPQIQHLTPEPAPLPPTPAPAPAPTPARATNRTVTPPPPATRKIQPTIEGWKIPTPASATKVRNPVRKAEKAPEENNIGAGIVIFSIIGIIMLMRSCT